MTEPRGAAFVVPAWAVPGGTIRTATCRSCGASIAFVVSSKSGKWAPIDPDGTSHFATCPSADRWRR